MTQTMGIRSEAIWEAYAQFRRSHTNPHEERSADFVASLESLVAESSGALTMALLGESEEGRPIHRVRFGNGPTQVMIWARQHGDEALCSAALFDFLGLLVYPEGAEIARVIGKHLTLHVIPIVNPDGVERLTRRNAMGIDINRDGSAQQTREGQAMAKLFNEVKPEVCFTLHDQEPRKSTKDKGNLIAISYQACPFNKAETLGPNLLRAQRICAAMITELSPWIEGHMSRYEADYMPRSFGDSTSRWGSATVLIESGGWFGTDEESEEYVLKCHLLSLIAGLVSVASGSERSFDPEIYTRLPLEGEALFDLIIHQPLTLIGDGSRPMLMDIGINRPDHHLGVDDWTTKIKDVGDMSEFEGRRNIDAAGLVATPGLIEVNPDFTRSDLKKPDVVKSYLKRGITTVVGRGKRGRIEPNWDVPLRAVFVPEPERQCVPKAPLDENAINAHGASLAKALNLSGLGRIWIGDAADIVLWRAVEGSGPLRLEAVEKIVVAGHRIDIK